MIYIDADACPVTRIAEETARRHGIPVTLLCDTNHVLSSDYSTIKIIGAGVDAVDLALINLCQRGDIVITQDYSTFKGFGKKIADHIIHSTSRIIRGAVVQGIQHLLCILF